MFLHNEKRCSHGQLFYPEFDFHPSHTRSIVDLLVLRVLSHFHSLHDTIFQVTWNTRHVRLARAKIQIWGWTVFPLHWRIFCFPIPVAPGVPAAVMTSRLDWLVRLRVLFQVAVSTWADGASYHNHMICW